MNNAELLLKTASRAGIEVCFTNFGTTEIPLTLAFDTCPEIRPVMCLFEGVCAGAADGWGRLTGRPAMTLLHLGPGMANGISTLHDARRARTPLFNVVGDHQSWHVGADPPLAMDIEALAATVSGWYRTVMEAGNLAADTVQAIDAARFGQVSTLIVPNDIQKQPAEDTFPERESGFEPLDADSIGQASALLEGGGKIGLLLGGKALREGGLRLAARIRDRTGCDLLSPVFPACLDRGGDLPELKRLPYFPDKEAEFLAAYDGIVLAGAGAPVAFFAEAGIDSYLGLREKPVVRLTAPKQDVIEALELLAESVNAPDEPEMRRPDTVPQIPMGELNAQTACEVLAAVQPEGAVIVDEGLSSAIPYYRASRNSPRHTLTTIVGGALGYGMPCSIGTAMACPDRPVINYQADGSAMYTVQALWTIAREKLNITTLIASNRAYDILRIEMDRAGADIGPRARSLMEIRDPDIDWVGLAQSLGVPARRADTTGKLAEAIRYALEEKGPHLIQVPIR